MPAAQLISAGIELALNQLLKLDPQSNQRLTKLKGKSLEVKVKELPWPLLFSFSEQIDLMALTPPQAEQSSTADCLIELDLDTLPKLKDTSQLTQLIQQQQLNLVGDIYVAQTFSSLIKDLDIDWEEHLSHYIGDVAAHQSFSTARSVIDATKQQLEQGSKSLGQRLTQSDSLAVSQQEVADFSQQVNTLRSATERLEARLALLERASAKADDN
ncbi:ubiquinone biosynthesis accessory factor UbiJ [Paraglaciecola aestuariivivens]